MLRPAHSSLSCTKPPSLRTSFDCCSCSLHRDLLSSSVSHPESIVPPRTCAPDHGERLCPCPTPPAVDFTPSSNQVKSANTCDSALFPVTSRWRFNRVLTQRSARTGPRAVTCSLGMLRTSLRTIDSKLPCCSRRPFDELLRLSHAGDDKATAVVYKDDHTKMIFGHVFVGIQTLMYESSTSPR